MFLGAWLAASGGCNCLIDADKYRGGPSGDGGSGIDGADNIDGTAPPDGRIESDAGPIEPTSAREGEGSGTGAPPAVIVLRGDFEPDSTARVVRTGDDTDLVASPAVVATDGSMLAIPIRIPVYEDLDDTETATLEVYVDDSTGPEDLIANFAVDGLLEADLSGTVDTSTLQPVYSRITSSTSVAFAGASPAILRSTSDITIDADLVAAGEQGGAAGPGGCPGGAATTSGGCGTHGGTGGVMQNTGGGGGGGGHADTGSTGIGGADGGEPSGNDMLTPISEEGGHGGGGGGDGLAELTAGGPGGGGGGIVELSASGTVTLDGLIDVRGGAGTDGERLATCGVGAGGSGGGGSGGAILATGAAIDGAGSLDATMGPGATRCNAGGNGSAGRIRIDVASQDLPALAADPTPVRGPHWADDIEPIQRDADFTATLYGEPNRTFAANLDGSEPVDVETSGSGIGSYHITLEPGHNRICAIVSRTANLSLQEAVRCMVVTYVP